MRAVLLALLLAGCATGYSLDQQAYLSCSAYANTLNALAGYRAAGKLSPSQVQTVTAASSVIGPACMGYQSGTTSAAATLDTIEAQLFKMIEVKKEADNG